MASYLVTGGLGSLGAPLVRALAASGHRVRVLDNASRGSAERLQAARSAVEIVMGDVRDAATVAAALNGMDGVCHLAFVNGTRHFYEQPATVLEVGVKGMLNVLDGSRHAGVRELLLVSSSEVYQTPPRVPTDETVPLVVPDPHNPRYSYGGGKIISELLALHSGVSHFQRIMIVRPHNVFGPDMGWEHVIPQFIGRLLHLKQDHQADAVPFPIQGTGTQTRAFIYLDDFVAGMLRVLERGEHRQIYHLGTMEELAIRDVAERVARQLDMRIHVMPGSEPQGATPRRCPDIRKLQRLGFQPRYRFDEGLVPTVAWYRAHIQELQPAAAPAVAGCEDRT